MDVATLKTSSGVDAMLRVAYEGGSVFIAAAAVESAITTDPVQASATNLYRWVVSSRGSEPDQQSPPLSDAESFLAEISVEPPGDLSTKEGRIFPGGSGIAPQKVWQWDVESIAGAQGRFRAASAVDHCELDLELELELD
ncbi:hypothetical protein [Herbiconiux solani]|uniref:hypothetical protein n=1 Tax=Herbiconiux solani TaxID=661329 RepID=UPI000824A869|nr:hypothetical protein [Herbiconiux solani]